MVRYVDNTLQKISVTPQRCSDPADEHGLKAESISELRSNIYIFNTKNKLEYALSRIFELSNFRNLIRMSFRRHL